MAKRQSPEETITNWFIRCTPAEAVTMVDRINLIMRTRAKLTEEAPQITTEPRKPRGRPRKVKPEPPLMAVAVADPHDFGAPANGAA